MTALLTAVLAFFGAGAGALFALNRFKKERAFDVRLEWYKRVIELLQKSVLEIRHLTQALRTQPQDEDVIETAYGRLTKALIS